jgi:hypothetical protein
MGDRLSKNVIAGFIPATHGAECSAAGVVAGWVAGTSPAMTDHKLQGECI